MVYIQRKDNYGLETVDHAESRKAAHVLLREYRMADPFCEHYLSQRACKGYWPEDS